METIIIQSSDRDTLARIKAFLKALKVSYKVEMVEENNEMPYNTEFVQKILENAESAKEGNVIEYTEPLRIELFL